MKNLLIFSFSIFLCITAKAQVETTGEINFFLINDYGYSVDIKMELLSPLCWDATANYPDVHNITDLFEGGSLNNSTNTILEFLCCWETSYPNYFRTFGLGKYKFTAKVNGVVKDYFDIDYRTSDLPEKFNAGGSGDINITFDVSDGNFYYKGTRTLFPTSTTIWDEKPWINHITTGFEPLPPDDFELTSSGGHPYLSWYDSYNEGDYWTGYCIYRSVVSGRGVPPGSFTKIATLSKQTTNYTDYNFAVSGPMTAYYKVTAINGERESDFTETLNIYVGLYKEHKNELKYNYSLEQNYPNPFNPITMISFSLKENSVVTLKVFDMLGREAANLVNGTLTAGAHQIQFNGSDLESGVYFYEIRAGDFRDVKKLILLK